jgi:HlyD family secretion protein
VHRPELDWHALRTKLAAWRGRIAALAVLVALAAYFLPDYLLGPRIAVAEAARREVVQSVVASGRVAAPNRVDIGSQLVGTVANVPVAEGQAVKAGQTLIELESTEARAAEKQAEVAVAQAEARLRQLRELQLPVAGQSLRQARANLQNAQVQFERNKKLYEAGYVGKAVLDDAQRNLDVAETQVKSAAKQVETARPSGSDYAVALTTLDQARASLQAARARLAYTVIRAPVDGTLIARDVERGDVVQPGKVLMVLSPAGATQLVLQIDERNLGKLKLGQQALASADAYAAQKFPAVLAYINPGIDAQRGTVEVKLDVPDPPDYLRQDMTVSVDIEIARRASALVIPAEAVRESGNSAPWVLKAVNGRARRQAVKLGLAGGGMVEVLDGLSAGDVVVTEAATRLRDGGRLRPVKRG